MMSTSRWCTAAALFCGACQEVWVLLNIKSHFVFCVRDGPANAVQKGWICHIFQPSWWLHLLTFGILFLNLFVPDCWKLGVRAEITGTKVQHRISSAGTRGTRS